MKLESPGGKMGKKPAVADQERKANDKSPLRRVRAHRGIVKERRTGKSWNIASFNLPF